MYSTKLSQYIIIEQNHGLQYLSKIIGQIKCSLWMCRHTAPDGAGTVRIAEFLSWFIMKVDESKKKKTKETLTRRVIWDQR